MHNLKKNIITIKIKYLFFRVPTATGLNLGREHNRTHFSQSYDSAPFPLAGNSDPPPPPIIYT